jgi:hypothetical protein
MATNLTTIRLKRNDTQFALLQAYPIKPNDSSLQIKNRLKAQTESRDRKRNKATTSANLARIDQAYPTIKRNASKPIPANEQTKRMATSLTTIKIERNDKIPSRRNRAGRFKKTGAGRRPYSIQIQPLMSAPNRKRSGTMSAT